MVHEFDITVIGKGLAGSATAKYLAAANQQVAIIGPDEPTNYSTAQVFASHYDQARVQRLIGVDDVWTKLNVDSTKQYSAIETATGINFHHGVGCLYVNPYGADSYLNKAPALAATYQLPYQMFTCASTLKHQFADYHFPAASMGMLETAPAGFINPLKLIEAQLQIFKQHQGEVFTETIVHVEFVNNKFHAKSETGKTFVSNKIVVAAGSFTNYQHLISQQLAIKTKSEVVLLAQVNETEAIRLSTLPSLLYEINTPQYEGVYLIQPVKYPDGNYYLKLGCNMPEDIFFTDLQQIQHWFSNGDTTIFEQKLQQILHSIMPALMPIAYQTKKCIISRTATKRPYIGETKQKGLYIALGCNGYSAMCADAIGNIAAHVVQEQILPEGYSNEMFTIV
jgi:glycine/D-amino acid oxidase-like deaminating enzyme